MHHYEFWTKLCNFASAHNSGSPAYNNSACYLHYFLNVALTVPFIKWITKNHYNAIVSQESTRQRRHHEKKDDRRWGDRVWFVNGTILTVCLNEIVILADIYRLHIIPFVWKFNLLFKCQIKSGIIIDQFFRVIVIQIHSHLTENKEMTRTGEGNNLRLVYKALHMLQVIIIFRLILFLN